MSVDASRARALLEAIGRRDFERVREAFAPDARFRVLTPGPLRELEGAEEAEGRYRYWLERLEPFELLDGDVDVIADRVRIRYRFRGRDPERGWQLNEHTGYAALDEDGRIRTLILTCSGFRPTDAP